MAKIAIISLNLLAIITYNLFFGGDVSVDQKIPESVTAGESFIMEIAIEKGDRQGFAKWQQTLPEGFIAEAKETHGATFSFKNQDVKLIWMALPEEESFTITYEVFTEPMIRGNFDVNGKFSFIEENERKDVTAEIKQIEVLPAEDVLVDDIPSTTEESDSTESEDDLMADKEEQPEVTDEEAEETSEEETASEEIAENTDESDAKTSDEETDSPEKKNYITNTDDVKISRQIEHIQDGRYAVTLTIDKGDFKSFGKVEEYLPPGFIATEQSSQQGKFSFEDKVMKILWMALPDVDQLSVSYGIESTTDELDSATIHGVFSYLDDDESKQVAMKGSRFKNYYTAPLADIEEEIEEAADGETPTEITEEQAEEIAEVVEEEKTQVEEDIEAEVSESKNLEDEITNIPAPETDVRYKVQIAAAKKEVNQQYFIDRHGITESVSTEFHNSWYKYTLGSYEVYRQARDKRNQVWANDNKIKDAFVTAYNSGERISVQEALMITNQKWFK